MTQTPLLSVVLPVYNEGPCLGPLHERLTAALASAGLPHEIIFVDDGSSDDSLAVLTRLQEVDPSVAVVVLARNFGHQTALTAGLEFAKGQAVVSMDADLQHPPEMIPALIERWRAGFKVVAMVAEDTDGIGPFKKLTSELYYRVFNNLSRTRIRGHAGDFRLLDRQAVDALKAMPERHRFLRGMIGWLGLPETTLSYTAPRRAAGRSKFTPRKMLRMAADGLFSFSTAPLRVALWAGLAALLVTGIYAAWVLYMFAFHNSGFSKGWASSILLTAFLSSVQLILTGIVGEYVGRVYEEVKARPHYIVRELRPRR